MNGIEKITARIDADTQAEIDRILGDAHAQAEAIAAKYRSQAAAEDADLLVRSQKAAAELKKTLGGKVVTVKASAGEGGKLFGSVTSAQVAEALGAQFGCSVDKKDIKLDDSIKQAGSFAFKIKLYPGIDAEMTLKVETE